MESEMYKEYHLSQGIFYNFVNFSPQHLHIYQNLILVRCIGISRTFHVSLSRCQKDGIFYHISGARFTNIKNIRSKPNITNKPSITNITNITKERKEKASFKNLVILSIQHLRIYQYLVLFAPSTIIF